MSFAGDAPHSERAGIGLAEVQQALGPGAILDARRSLAITDAATLAPITLNAVLNQLILQSGGTLTSAQLFRQLWDTQNPAPGQSDLPGNAHCTDNSGTLNGFAYPCRLTDGQQAQPAGAITINSYIAIGLYNRFDLAPLNGANCGEYRAVFGKQTGVGPGRAFIIFEAVLPNPRTDLGLEGCRPVAELWRDLSTAPNRAALVQSFYFTGLPGFRPVFHVDNYGAGSTGGQVRTNQFVQPPWLLREFKLLHNCGSGGTPPCPPRFVPATVKTNPFGSLFNPALVHPLASQFQTVDFINQVPALAVNNLNTFTMAIPDLFNPGQSDSQTGGVVDNYVAQFGAGPNAFRTAIQAKLTSIGSALTPDQIVARAQTQSCGGCHQRSNGAVLGGGLVWPSSDPSGFVQSSEFIEASADGPRFRISPALTNVFLPHRKAVLESFLNQLRTVASGRTGLARVAAAEDAVFFSEVTGTTATSTQITKIASGGSAVALVTGRPGIIGIAADAQNVYWSESSGGIFKVPVGGGAVVTLISGRTGLGAVAVAGTTLFWWENTSTGVGSIMRIPTAGGASSTLASGRPAVRGIAVDANNVYWVESASLIAFDRALGIPLTINSAMPPISSLSTNGGVVYWADAAGVIRSTPGGGGAVSVLHAGVVGLLGAAVDDFSFSWIEAGGSVRTGPK